MCNEIAESRGNIIPFGRRKGRPHACVIGSKPDTRAFLKEALDGAGFSAGECAEIDELAALLVRQPPALVVVWVAPSGIESAHVLNKLSAANFEDKLLLLGPRNLPALAAVDAAVPPRSLADAAALSYPSRGGVGRTGESEHLIDWI